MYTSWTLLFGWLIIIPIILNTDSGMTTPLIVPDTAYIEALELPKIASKVYKWEPAEYRYVVQYNPLIQGSTTHLRSLSIETVTLFDNIMSVTKTDDSLNSAINHHHSERLLIVKEGKVSINIDTGSKKVGPGSVALILPGDHYSVQNPGDTPAVYYLLKYQSKSPVDLERGRQAGGSFIIDWNEIDFREHDKGGRRDFFDRPTAMCENFEMHVTNLNLNTSSHAPHTHQVEEIILMVQGNISMHIDGHESEATAGDFAFVDSMVPHAPTNIGSEQAIYFAFQWK